MKKMVYILGFYPVNGRSYKILKTLKEYNDVEIKYVYWNISNIKIKKEDEEEFIFTENKKFSKLNKFLSFYKFYNFIKKTIKEYEPDIIWAYHWDVFILVKLLFLKNKKIYYEISDIPSYSGILYWFLKKIEEFFISKNDYLIFASRFFVEKYPQKKIQKYIVIDNKPEKYLLMNKEKYPLEFYGIRRKELNITFAGVYRDFEILKNIIDIIEIKENVNLLFWGEGNIEEKLKKYCKNKKNIYILGRYDYSDISKIYNVSDVILSLYSNKDINTKLATGNKFFKVQAFKKIGIFPKNTKMGEYMEKTKCGLVINPYNKMEILEAVNEILNNTLKIQKIKENLNRINEKEIFWEYEKIKLKGVL